MYKVNLSESFSPAQSDSPLEALTIGEALRRRVDQTPDHIALKEISPSGENKRQWSFQALQDDAMRLARAMASRHKPGARVAIFAHNIPEWVLVEFACALSRITLVTVNPSYQVRELVYVLEQSKAEGIYFVDFVRGNPLGDIVRAACADNGTIKHMINLQDHEALFAGADGGTLPDVQPDDIAQIQYTSGTTGFPKGALLHHKGLVQNSRDCMMRSELSEGDTFINMMPLFHTTGCSVMVLGGLQLGMTMLLPPGFDPVLACVLTEKEKINFIVGVATMLVAIMAEARTEKYDLSSVKSVLSGGAMVPPELVRQYQALFGCPIQIVYGQTEASPVITQVWKTDSLEDLTETVGQALPHMDVSIRDPQTNAVCAIGEQGEICARGYMVMKGYNDNPEATKATIDAEGWLHTGDLGRMDARGFVKITGRVKEMIIRGGENIFPVEIENAMLEHPIIEEIAVVGIPDEKWGEQIACFMRSTDGSSISNDDLKAFIRDRISPQKTPAYWIWVESWPLTGSGKIQKFVLRDQFVEGKFKPA